MTDNGQMNLADHDSFTSGVPHKTFQRLRKEDPVHWTPAFGGAKGFWSLTRYDDIMACNKDFQRFSSAQGIRIEDQSHEEYMARRTFQETDPPEHSATRRLVNGAFAKPVIARFEGLVQELAEGIVANAVEKGECDAVEEIAKQLPMMMLGRIMGVPDADLEWLVTKGDALIGNTDPDFTDTVMDKMDTDAYRLMPFRSPAGIDLYDYAEEILGGRKPISDDGVLARILNAEEKMDERAFKNFFCLLVAAGNDTTRYSIAMSLYHLAKDSALFDQLRTGSFYETAPDEFIRLASPTLHFRRTATEDISLHGKNIRQGDKVLMWFVSGSRDETIFDDPHKPNLARTPNRHLAFGQGGPHVCLGMWLARLELRVVLQELAKQVRAIELLEDPTWTRSNFICGVKQLNVRMQK